VAVTYRCRCKKCRSRRNLRKDPRFYADSEMPRCWCGSRSWRIDMHRQLGKEAERQTCYCGALPFPHRKGSNFMVDQDGQPMSWCPRTPEG
jgi:hypothetical protein